MSLFNRLLHRSVPLEDQLQTLARCGIHPRPGITVSALLESFNRDVYENDPFRLASIRLGGTREQEPFDYLSDNIWHLDTECIEDHGDYVTVAERIRALSQGELPISDIKDYVDVEAATAWLSFKLDDREIRWDAEVNDDWIDPHILSNFVSLFRTRDTVRRLTYLDLKGQDCLIGCSTAQEMDDLKKLANLPFTWLE